MIIIEEDEYGVCQQRCCDYGKIHNHNLYLIDLFLRSKQLEGLSPLTLNNYKGIILLLDDIKKPLDEIASYDIKHFLAYYQSTHNISNLSLDNMRRVLSSFYGYLDDENMIYKNPVKSVHKIKSKSKIKKPFSEEEVVRLQDACHSLRDRALVDFLYSTGVRVSELCRLNREDIDYTNRELIVFGKGNKERVVYFDYRTKVHLLNYVDSRDDHNNALFITSKKPFERLTLAGVEYILCGIGEKAKVPKCHPHRFRRTLATRLINRGMPIEQVQKLLGHIKIDTTLIYAQVDQANVKLSHERFV